MLTNILLEANLIGFGQKMTLENFFVFPWSYGPKYSFTSAYWFIPVFFLCVVIHQVIRFLIKRNTLLELLATTLSIILGGYFITKCNALGGMYGGAMRQYQMLLAKVFILLPFMFIGQLMSRDIVINYLKKCSTPMVLLFLFGLSTDIKMH